MKKSNVLSLISQIRNKADKFIMQELSLNGIAGLAPSHGEILAQLFSKEELTMRDIAEKICRSKPTVTVLIDKLVVCGYVIKLKSETDSRVTFIRLTPAGLALQPLLQSISGKLNTRVYAGMSSADAVALEATLSRIERNLERK